MKVLILAGGSGSRLWPLSRTRYPKQFIKLLETDHSLFQETYLRALEITDSNHIKVITSKDYGFIVESQVLELGHIIPKENLILEPSALNTLPAILAGIEWDLDETYLVMPSDHLIAPEETFVKVIKKTIPLANQKIVTFGIKPDHPHTGYGYIAPGENLNNGFIVDEFKEKPDIDTANEYISNGYFWNAGIFMFSTDVIKEELEAHQEKIIQVFLKSDSIDETYKDIDKGISIDYGLLEKSSNVAVVPLVITWNDLGSFDSLIKESLLDINNNSIQKESIFHYSSNNLIKSGSNKIIALNHVNDLIVVDTPDALLISKKGYSQEVKGIVDILKEKTPNTLDFHKKDYRPWGDYNVLDELSGLFKVKRINVLPGKRLSYQMHHHRSEHWIVVNGTATVTLDDEVFIIEQGKNIFINQQQKHRLQNDTKAPLEIIEVQLGSYLEEEDIIRFEDDFNRN